MSATRGWAWIVLPGALALSGILLASGDPVGAVAGLAAGGFAMAAVSDYRDLRLPDAITIPLTVGGVAAVAAGVWPGALADACAGVAALIGLGAIGTAAGRQLGVEIGQGDWKLLAATGAWLGLSGGAVAASISWLLAGAVLAAAYRMRPGEPVQLAFGVILGPVAVVGLLLTGLDALGG
ncbi:MAG: prepilin peptidase [Thalassobaculum sp.]|uniref:prepilin peptidase n=1 Tax=Thalassobaculum sp. TaxID=2022740 RepID=UPI0032EDE169